MDLNKLVGKKVSKVQQFDHSQGLIIEFEDGDRLIVGTTSPSALDKLVCHVQPAMMPEKIFSCNSKG